MSSFSFNNVNHVLCLGAHADDIEIGCGATILKLLAANAQLKVTWIVLSADGLRIAEARKSGSFFLRTAAEHAIEVFDFPDRYFPSVWPQMKDYFSRLATRIDPDLIFTHRLEDRHQDHRLTAELTWNAFRRHTILEYEIPKYEGDLGHPNVFVSLAESEVASKLELLWDCFPSQHDKPWYRPETFRSLMTLRGVEAGPSTTYAEAFYARKLFFE